MQLPRSTTNNSYKSLNNNKNKNVRRRLRALSSSSSAAAKTMYIRDWRTVLRTPPTYGLGNCTFRFHFQIALIICFGTMTFLFLYVNNMTSSSDNWIYKNINIEYYNATYPLTTPIITNGLHAYRIAIIADLDTNSKVKADPPYWKSYYKKGYLNYNPTDSTVTVTWDDGDPLEIRSYYALKDRGMELSELVVFNGRLLTFDDRTGLVYEILHDKVIPWIILADGNGYIGKGFKSEWATVKDKMLYVGSMGKEWTTSHGVYENDNPMYIKIVSPNGEIHHMNWSNNYKAIRNVLDISWPGYMIHESGMWSQKQRQWYFLPRRCSKEKYNETRDEHMGCNVLITSDEIFNNIKATKIGKLEPTHGYSSFKFVPGTNDNIIVALITEEVNGKTDTYISSFTVDGNILMEPKKVSGNYKLEGIEFI